MENQEEIQNLNETILQEDTTGPAADNIATSDEDLSINQMFQQGALPSLGRQIFSVVPMHGPTAALFNIKVENGDVVLLRNNAEVYPSQLIKTGMTGEVIQDIKSQFGKNAKPIINKLLRGLANEDENTKTLAFLDTNAKTEPVLTLSDAGSSFQTASEISQKVSAIIAKANSKNFRTFEACVVLPYTYAGTIIAQTNVGRDNSFGASGLFVGKYGQTQYFINPDSTDTKAYVLLKDSKNISKSAAVFSPYQEEVIEAQDPDSGNMVYFIANRFAITASPLHELNNEMMFKFEIA